MTENVKTIAFVFVGLVAIGIALLTRPTSAELDDASLVGADLTKKFESPDAAKRLRIVRFDEDTATLRDFEVAEKDGLWSIPSKDGYPADAARPMAEATTSLMDRKILAVASKNAGDHEQYGVKDPLSPKLEVGAKGVGTRVTMSDVHGQPLVDLIVGKAVKDAEGQRYVREAGRDIVYIIEIDPAKLSTNFEDWIEKDLLKLNSWDLQQVQIKDYSAELVQGISPEGKPVIGIDRRDRADMTLAYNESDSTWNAVQLRRFDPQAGENGEYIDFTLAEDEELNEESLNALKTSLDDLQIVDVVRKPAGLSQDLKAGADFLNNREALISLMTKGFTAAASAPGAAEEFISSDGEVVVTMKNGAEYVLRFGNLTNVDGGGQEGEPASAGGETDQAAKNKDSDVHRYLFVMARFNEGAAKEPDLEEVPNLPAENESGEPASAEDESGEPASAEDQSGEPASAGGETETDASNNDAPADAATDEEDQEAEEAATAENAETDRTEDTVQDREKLLAEQQRIVAENQRKQDAYEQLKEKGRETVKDLNLRFGDWYFVVDDDVFKKVRLGRESVVKKKEKKEVDGESASADGSESETVSPAATIPGLPPIPGTQE